MPSPGAGGRRDGPVPGRRLRRPGRRRGGPAGRRPRAGRGAIRAGTSSVRRRCWPRPHGGCRPTQARPTCSPPTPVSARRRVPRSTRSRAKASPTTCCSRSTAASTTTASASRHARSSGSASSRPRRWSASVHRSCGWTCPAAASRRTATRSTRATRPCARPIAPAVATPASTAPTTRRRRGRLALLPRAQRVDDGGRDPHHRSRLLAGSISWFQNNPSSVSAHYLDPAALTARSTRRWCARRRRRITSAARTATRSASSTRATSTMRLWHTTAMYNASRRARPATSARAYSIPCSSASTTAPPAAASTSRRRRSRIDGHQHYLGQTHTDPGINWDRQSYTRCSIRQRRRPRTLRCGFESGEGHFGTAPAYSGSSTGIAASSTAERDCTVARVGSCSEHLRLIDNPSNTQPWAVRFPVRQRHAVGQHQRGAQRQARLLGLRRRRRLQRRPAAWTIRTAPSARPCARFRPIPGPGSNGTSPMRPSGTPGSAATARSPPATSRWTRSGLERAHTTYTVNVYLDEVRWTPN